MTINTIFTVTGLWKAREYRVLREFDGHIATVDIPHQRKPSACLHFSKADLIRTAHRCTESNGSWQFCTWSAKELTDCYGAGDEPAEAMEIALENGTVVQYNEDWLKPSEADEYEWALDYFGHDLSGFHTFDSIADAVEFAESYNRHGSGDANEALAEELLRYDFIELVEEEDDAE